MTTSKPSPGTLFGNDAVPSTSSLGGVPVKTSAPPAKVLDLVGPAAGSGLKCSESSAKCNPHGCSLRTYLLSRIEGLTPYWLAWKRQATPAGRWWWVLGPSGLRTNGTDAGLWPTAAAAQEIQGQNEPDGRRGQTLVGSARGQDWQTPDSAVVMGGHAYRGGKRGEEPLLRGQVLKNHWPTATVCGNHNYAGASANSGNGLSTEVKQWPTPTASEQANRNLQSPPSHGVTRGLTLGGLVGDLREAASWPTPKARDVKGVSQRGAGAPGDALANMATFGPLAQEKFNSDGSRRASSTFGSLNGRWVLTLMGYPATWCDLPDDEIRKLSKPRAIASSRKSQKS